MSSTEPCGIETFYVHTSGILNAMPSTGPCGIEMFYVDASWILNAMPSTGPCTKIYPHITFQCHKVQL
jgi:cytochrome c5